MTARVRFAASLLAAALVATVLTAAANTQPRLSPGGSGLTVHEWGTFTSVAGPDGRAVSWYPLSQTSDLPCFVRVFKQTSPKVLVSGLPVVRATVRMETPVIYFYSDKETRARVSVRFPQGLITEWYPDAVVPTNFLPADAADGRGAIDWPEVVVRPGAAVDFPREPADSHYYPARETDAAPVFVGGQAEKFLFYRGMAGFPVTVEARVLADGRIAIRNIGRDALRHVILFRNDGGRLGYTVVRNLAGEVSIAAPKLGANFEALADELTAMLVDEGLFVKEARAMVETWRDSWFEEGTRAMYLLPREDVDRILPLTVSPSPKSVVRAFVGRVEIITPEFQNEVEQMLLRGDLMGLSRCGRFLQPAVDSIAGRASLAGMERQIDNLLRLSAAANTPEDFCPEPVARR